MLILVIALYALGVALPIAGLLRLLIHARQGVAEVKNRKAEENAPMISVRGGAQDLLMSLGDVTAAGRNSSTGPFASWRTATLDIIFIGVGVIASGAASIISLFLP